MRHVPLAAIIAVPTACLVVGYLIGSLVGRAARDRHHRRVEVERTRRAAEEAATERSRRAQKGAATKRQRRKQATAR